MGAYNREGPMPVEIYVSTPSVSAGDSISFHVSATPDLAGNDITVEVYRSNQFNFLDSQFGRRTDSIYQSDYRELISLKSGVSPCFPAVNIPATNYPIPPNAFREGCNWPVACTWSVPTDQASRVYIARAACQDHISYAVFVVKSKIPGSQSKVVCQLSVNTYQAYNPWGGACFYGEPVSQSRVNTVSFARPCHLLDYILYDEPIVTWLEANASVEFITNIDVDKFPNFLESFNLFISCGHDEYWSEKMRNQVECFAEKGGNVLFLSGNTTYRPVRFDEARQQMVKTAETWQAQGRHEALTTGLAFSSGAWTQALPKRGFAVMLPCHWMFDGTGLTTGGKLGEAAGVIGYETDAGIYKNGGCSGIPVSPSPANLVTIANADLKDWEVQPGYASIAAHWRKKGYVLTVGSTGWGQGLGSNPDRYVKQVMSNILHRMSSRFVIKSIIYAVDDQGNLRWYPVVETYGVGDFSSGATIGWGGWQDYKCLTGDETGAIYAVSTGGQLYWYRDQDCAGRNTIANRQIIGQGGWQEYKFVFSGGDGIIYAISEDGNLYWYRDKTRYGTGDVTNRQIIGQGDWQEYKFVFSGGDGIIYAISEDGNLYWYRDKTRYGTGDVTNRQIIDQSGWQEYKFVFSGSDGIIYAISGDGNLYWYRDKTCYGTGYVANRQIIGRGGWNSFKQVFSDSQGNIYAITSDGNLLAYKDSNQNGTGDLSDPVTIGRGGWDKIKQVFAVSPKLG